MTSDENGLAEVGAAGEDRGAALPTTELPPAPTPHTPLTFIPTLPEITPVLVMSPVKVDAFRILMPVLAEMVPALAMPPATPLRMPPENADKAAEAPVLRAVAPTRMPAKLA
jgi:hypothetical protein